MHAPPEAIGGDVALAGRDVEGVLGGSEEGIAADDEAQDLAAQLTHAVADAAGAGLAGGEAGVDFVPGAEGGDGFGSVLRLHLRPRPHTRGADEGGAISSFAGNAAAAVPGNGDEFRVLRTRVVVRLVPPDVDGRAVDLGDGIAVVADDGGSVVVDHGEVGVVLEE